jgi:hypothetical protein
MKSIAIKMVVAAVALGAAVLALAGTASASHVKAELTVPDQATVGQPMEVQATLHSADGGSPVADVLVVFSMDASFGGVSGYVELGRAMTDGNGVATLLHEHRIASEHQHQMRIEYLPPGETDTVVLDRSMTLAGGNVQLHRSTAGVNIPGLNVWLLIALVTTVWAILLSVALRVIAISRAGGDGGAMSESDVSGAR